MADVVGLHDRLFKPDGSANETVVAKLEGYLDQARRGEIDGIAIALSRPNGRIQTDFYLGPASAVFRVVAAAASLQHDLCATINDVPQQDGPGDGA